MSVYLKALFIWLMFINFASSQRIEINNIDSIFIFKKSLNYDRAISKAQLIHEPWLRKAVLNILLFETQQEIEILQEPSEPLVFPKNFVLKLNKAYEELSKRRYGNERAFEYLIDAFEIANEAKNVNLEKVALIAIFQELKSQIFLGSKQFTTYLDAFKLIIEDTEDFAILSLNETILFSKSNDTLSYDIVKYDLALKKLDSVFTLLEKSNKYYPYYYHEKGIENKLNKDFDRAHFYFTIVDSITAGRKQYRRLNATNYWQLSDMFLKSGNLSGAKKYWDKSTSMAIDLRDTFYDNRLGASYYRRIKDFEKAFNYLKESNKNEYELSAKTYSFMSNQLSKEFEEESRVKYETAQKEKQLIIEQQKVKENRNWLIVSAIVLVMGAGVAVLLQKNTLKKRQLAEQEAALKQQKVENLLKEQELRIIDAIITGQEKEREKVAGELHDDLGSLMATIKLHFDNAKVNEDDPAMKNAQKLLDEAYKKIRGMAHSKSSGVMSDQGLLPAIQKMAGNITKTGAITVSVEDFGLGDRMENSLELLVFRMIQELVANAIKHASASKVNIQLTEHEDNLNIIVEDNGQGFDRSKLDKRKSGMGLTNIEKHVEHLEGNFTVDSFVGKGTSIIIDLPI